jgi:hypothetical protein
MADGDKFHYALTITAKHASTAAYYALTPTSNLHIEEGSVTLTPKSASATMVTIEPEMLQIQAPAGSVQGGVTIGTDAVHVDGQVTVSPPVDVEVIVALYGIGGKKVGEFVVAPGDGGGVFEFRVDAAQSIPPGELDDILGDLVPREHT